MNRYLPSLFSAVHRHYDRPNSPYDRPNRNCDRSNYSLCPSESLIRTVVAAIMTVLVPTTTVFIPATLFPRCLRREKWLFDLFSVNYTATLFTSPERNPDCKKWTILSTHIDNYFPYEEGENTIQYFQTKPILIRQCVDFFLRKARCLADNFRCHS